MSAGVLWNNALPCWCFLSAGVFLCWCNCWLRFLSADVFLSWSCFGGVVFPWAGVFDCWRLCLHVFAVSAGRCFCLSVSFWAGVLVGGAFLSFGVSVLVFLFAGVLVCFCFC